MSLTYYLLIDFLEVIWVGPKSDVGQGQCQEKFFMVGRSVGLSVRGESDGGGHCRTADGGRTEVLASL